MLQRLLFSFFLAIIALNILSAQGFEKTTTFRRITRITATADGGVIAIGSVRGSNGLEQVAAARYTPNGALLWLTQKDWGIVDAFAFALTPDDTGGWWIQGKPTILSPSAPLCNWHLNADGSEAAFFSGEGGLVHDALLLGDTLWKATTFYTGPSAFAVSPALTSPALASYTVPAGGAPNTDYLTTHRLKLAANGDLYMAGGLLTWLYGQVNGYYAYYISSLYPYLSVIKPSQATIATKTYPFKGSNIKDFVVLPNGQAKAIMQKIWVPSGTNIDTSYLFATDDNLEILWSKPFRNRLFEQMADAPDASGTVVCGTLKRASQQIAVLGKYSPTGDLIWEHEFGEAVSTALVTDAEGNVWLAVTPASGPTRLYKTDAQGQRRSNGLRGRVFQDNDQNCAFSPTIDGPLPGFRLVLVTDGDTLTAFSAPDGTFALPADTGVQRLLIFPDNPNYVRCQPDLLDFSFPGGTYDTLDFAIGFRDTCPNLRVKAATDLACGPGSGRAAFRVSGGGGDYDFHWNTGATDSLLTQLNAGIYWATISENGCETYDTLEVRFDFQALELNTSHYGSAMYQTQVTTLVSADGQYFYSIGGINSPTIDVDTVRGEFDIWVVKTDRQGQKIWSKTFGGSEYDRPGGAALGADGNIIITGETQSVDGTFPGVGGVLFLLKISPYGEPLWARKLDSVFSIRKNLYKIVAAPNGDYVVAGSSWETDPNTPQIVHLLLTRFDPLGNVIWSKEYGTGSAVYLRNMIADGVNGGYVVNCSMNGPDATTFDFIKVDEAGALVWQQQDWRLSQSFIRQMPNGGFLLANNYFENSVLRPLLVRTTPLGVVDTTVRFPGPANFFADIIRNGTDGWVALTGTGSAGFSSTSQIVRFNDQLQPDVPIPVPTTGVTDLNFLHRIGTDSFFIAGSNFSAGSNREGLLFTQVRLLIQHTALLAADTLVCPGSTVAFGLDSLAGDYAQIGWENLNDPFPTSIVTGAQDTVLRVLAQNAAGCIAIADRNIRAYKFRTDLETGGSTCTLANGQIWLNPNYNIGLLQINWADGSHALYRENLAPGIYPVMVSDSLCSQHFEPEIIASDEPLLVERTSSSFYAHEGGPFTTDLHLAELANGQLINWNAQGNSLRINGTLFPLPLNSYGYKVVALPDTGFAVIGSGAYNVVRFDRSMQLQGQYRLPFGLVTDLLPLPDGGYVAVGDSTTFMISDFQDGYQTVVVRLNKQFQPVWLSLLPSPGRSEQAQRVVLLPDGRIAVASQSILASVTSYNYDAQDVKISILDASGVLQSTRILMGELGEVLGDLAATNDGGIVAAVRSNSRQGDLTGLNNTTGGITWFFRMNADNQQIVWQRAETASIQQIGHFPDGTLVYRTAALYAGGTDPTIEHLSAISPQGDDLWSIRTADTFLLTGIPFYRGNGNIYIPRLWYDNYVSSGSHCCPSADFHLFFDIYRNGQTPQPFNLGPDTTLCIGDTLTLSAAAANAYITWSPGLYGPTLDVTRAGIYVATAGGLCSQTDTVRVDYCLYPPLPDSVAGCSPLAINGGMPGLAHQWSNGSTSETLQLTESAWLGLTVTNLAGQTVHDSIFATVYPSSTYEIEEQDIACYAEQSGSLSVTPSGESAPYQYTWSGGQQDSVLTGLPPGAYNLTVTDAFGCTFMEQFMLTQPLPWGVYNNRYLINDSTYMVEAHVYGQPTFPVQYQWSNGATGQYIQYPGGLLILTINDANGCAKSDTLDLPFLVSVKNPLNNKELRVFPNPANEAFFIENLEKTPESVTVRDITGREIALSTSTETAPNGSLRLRVACQDWAAGVYSLILRWSEGAAVVRVVKVGL